MPTHYVELDSEEMSYVEGGWFLGISVSVATATTIYNLASSFVRNKALGVPSIVDALKMIPCVAQLFSSITSKFLKVLATIPLWGKIIGGVLLGSLALATIYAGSQGKGFRVGVEIKRFSIKGVLEYT